MYGAIFENYVVAECLKKHTHRKTHSKLYYYRTSHGVEIDLILDHRSYKECIKIKAGETFHPKMVKTLEGFLETNNKGYLVYRGKNQPYHSLKIVNISDYFSQN